MGTVVCTWDPSAWEGPVSSSKAAWAPCKAQKFKALRSGVSSTRSSVCSQDTFHTHAFPLFSPCHGMVAKREVSRQSSASPELLDSSFAPTAALLAVPSTWTPALEVTILVQFHYLFCIQATPEITYKDMRRLLALDFHI